MEIKQYYLENINKKSYYSIYQNMVDEFDTDIEVFNNQIAINEYKALLSPRNEYSDIENYKFILLSYYLDKQGYIIEQFPNQIKYPTNLYDFAYNAIRNRIGGSRVTWNDRRKLISELKFIKSDTNIEDEEIEKIITTIATDEITFRNMSIDSKLENISNAIEYFMKNNGKFEEMPSSYYFDLLDNEKIKKYRKITQCFRHANKESINERREYSEKQKRFLLNIGVTIIIEMNNYRDQK